MIFITNNGWNFKGGLILLTALAKKNLEMVQKVRCNKTDGLLYDMQTILQMAYYMICPNKMGNDRVSYTLHSLSIKDMMVEPHQEHNYNYRSETQNIYFYYGSQPRKK